MLACPAHIVVRARWDSYANNTACAEYESFPWLQIFTAVQPLFPQSSATRTAQCRCIAGWTMGWQPVAGIRRKDRNGMDGHGTGMDAVVLTLFSQGPADS
eukprot:gene19748-biopygen10060